MKHRLNFVILIFIYSSSLFAQGGNIFFTNAGTISFKSDAPFELIKASNKELKGLLDVAKKNFAFKVRMDAFQGFNSALQKEHFNENYLESDKYPEASFSGKIIEDIDLVKDGTYTIRAKGNLMVHGVSQERIIKSDVVVKEGKIIVHSTFSVLLSDHNIPIPKVVKDKLAEEIKVDITALLEARKS